jgi:4-diphosphocytidyl-2-C-methyl-D-erythritol kinase
VRRRLESLRHTARDILPCMRVAAYGKINWSLRVTGKRADGYHDLETLLQTISLHDTLTFEQSDRLSLTCDDPTIPVDETNLVLRAARALKATVAIDLRKQIPAGGGLGGGSSDAAATLLALSKGQQALHEIALGLGSDVPFFLTGGTAYATGRGEILTPLPRASGIPLLLLIPEERVSTAAAFGMLQRFSPTLGIDRYRAMTDLLSHAAELVNDFEEPVFAMLPSLRTMKTRLLDSGAAWAAMSGSGSTIVGAFRSVADRDAARARFTDVRAVGAETI